MGQWDYLRGALGWEKRAILRTANKARSHTHTQAQATQPLHLGPPIPILTAFQPGYGPRAGAVTRAKCDSRCRGSPGKCEEDEVKLVRGRDGQGARLGKVGRYVDKALMQLCLRCIPSAANSIYLAIKPALGATGQTPNAKAPGRPPPHPRGREANVWRLAASFFGHERRSPTSKTRLRAWRCSTLARTLHMIAPDTFSRSRQLGGGQLIFRLHGVFPSCHGWSVLRGCRTERPRISGDPSRGLTGSLVCPWLVSCNRITRRPW